MSAPLASPSLNIKLDPFLPLEIILVEDDDSDARAVCRALAKSGIANPVRRFWDGEEALENFRTRFFDIPINYIILLDINMPRMTGHEFLEEMRNDCNLQEAIVFIMTTSGHEDDIERAYKKNVAGYILKSKVGEEFENLLSTLGHYWNTVEMPDMSRRRAP